MNIRNELLNEHTPLQTHAHVSQIASFIWTNELVKFKNKRTKSLCIPAADIADILADLILRLDSEIAAGVNRSNA